MNKRESGWHIGTQSETGYVLKDKRVKPTTQSMEEKIAPGVGSHTETVDGALDKKGEPRDVRRDYEIVTSTTVDIDKDESGRVVRIIEHEFGAMRSGSEAEGAVINDQIVREFNYDDENRIVEIQSNFPTKKVQESREYDGDGFLSRKNVKSLDKENGGSTEKTTNYTYDSAGRLSTRVNKTELRTKSYPYLLHDHDQTTYTYDEEGRLSGETRTPLNTKETPHSKTGMTAEYTYHEDGTPDKMIQRLSTYSKDERGEIIQTPFEGEVSYSFDSTQGAFVQVDNEGNYVDMYTGIPESTGKYSRVVNGEPAFYPAVHQPDVLTGFWNKKSSESN